MSIGIYCLYWDGYDPVYIGQSVEIEQRFITHKWYLRTDCHSNSKLQKAYHKYGTPSICILETCSSSCLNDLEILWTNEFDSLKHGLNIAEPGDSASGVYGKNSKYSQRAILKVFSLLYKTIFKHKDIAIRSNLPIHIIDDIASGRSHIWLKEKYPYKYSVMENNRSIRKHVSKPQISSLNRVHKPLVSPEGDVYHSITNIMGFCRDIGFSNIRSSTSKISAVLRETRASYLGWKLLQE